MPMDSDFIWMDGELVPSDTARVHILSHTLHYGYGAFEGIRAYRRADGESHVFRLEEHIERLFESAHILGLDMPFGRGTILEACVEVLRANRFDAAYLRPLVFLDEASLGLDALANRVRVAIAAWRWGAYLGEEGMARGIRCHVSSFSRLHVNVNMVKGKLCGQYVNSVMAKRQALKAGYDEAVMLDTQGYVCECTGENLFLMRRGRLVTSPFGSSILGGITRDTILTIAADLGIETEERRFTRDELYVADEVFVCGTAAEVTPVREIDDRTIGSGEPGPMTRLVSDRFFGIVRGDCPDHPSWRHAYRLEAAHAR